MAICTVPTLREREEVRMIGRLQTMNIYPVLIRKLTEGDSAASVARWAMSIGVEGRPGAWRISMWLHHIKCLRREVLEAKEKLRSEEHRIRRTVSPSCTAPDAVLANSTRSSKRSR
jgi:hypothetical protein